jgi:protein-tyrosine phosphatase
MNHQINVLFVCLGNICRSPTAHGVFQGLVDQAGLRDKIIVDSAATSDWHAGKSPDSRSMAHAHQRGYDLSSLRARQIIRSDFEQFDYIFGMDQSNMDNMHPLCPNDYRGHFELFLNFADTADCSEVPDPYCRGEDGFELVLDLVEEASRNLLAHIQREYF